MTSLKKYNDKYTDKKELESSDTTDDGPIDDENNDGFPPNDGDQQSSTHRKPSSRAGVGIPIWVVLLLFFGTIFFISSNQTVRYDVPLGSLLQLFDKIAALRPAEVKSVSESEDGDTTCPIPYIEIEEGTGTNTLTVRYSEPKKVAVTSYEIRGLITRQVTAPPGKTTAPAEVTFFSGRGGLNADDNELLRRLEKTGISDFRGEAAPNSFVHYFGPTVLMLLILVPLTIFLFHKIGAGAMAFGRNRSKNVSQEDVEVTFEDVAGVDEAVDELREIVSFLKTPEKYRVLGGRIPRGVLLVGPPGTGKTILAKAVAGEAGVPFLSLSGSDFVELYVGVGAARVRDLFTQAARQTPSIIFIDELDGLGKTRGANPNGSNDEREQTLNALLVELDGIGTNMDVIVLAASNRPETLDPALLRAGRFDRHVLVDRPDIQGREAILKVHSKKVKLDPAINLRDIAAITSGFVGADLAALVNEAALLAARADKKQVTMPEIVEAVERVTSGLEKRKRVIKPEEKKRIAAHESGHALVAHSIPGTDPVHKVSIIPRGLAALGYTLQRPEDDRYLMTKTELETRIQVLLGGILAEELLFDDVSTGAQNDLERATEIARSLVMDYGMSRLGRINFRENPRGLFLGNGSQIYPQRLHSEKTAWEIDQEIRSIVESLHEKTRQLLMNQQETLSRVMTRLLEKEVLENEELTAVIAETGIAERP